MNVWAQLMDFYSQQNAQQWNRQMQISMPIFLGVTIIMVWTVKLCVILTFIFCSSGLWAQAASPINLHMSKLV
jgi:hypothetical protein